ncbi:MAG: Abi family protein [Clostridia bacterium]|nr:Abi family protein [Clostridia bacterium]
MKAFFTYEQQIEKLKSKGLIIKDEGAARSFLEREGYYNVINGYSPFFKSPSGKFYNGTSFEDICNLYAFDKDLRGIMYKYTTSIETHIKALIAHEFSRAHGVDEKSYLTPACFSPAPSMQPAISRLITECNTTIAEALNHNSNKYREYIDHNFRAHGHVPMWVLVRALSFGTTSIFYKNMISAQKTAIASYYKVSASQLSNILEVVVSFRNIIAHGERTFCARLPKTRLSTTLEITRKLCIAKNSKGENKFGKNDFLSLLICCKYLLEQSELDSMINEISVRIDALGSALSPSMMGKIRYAMGIPKNNWRLLPRLVV